MSSKRKKWRFKIEVGQVWTLQHKRENQTYFSHNPLHKVVPHNKKEKKEMRGNRGKYNPFVPMIWLTKLNIEPARGCTSIRHLFSYCRLVCCKCEENCEMIELECLGCLALNDRRRLLDD